MGGKHSRLKSKKDTSETMFDVSEPLEESLTVIYPHERATTSKESSTTSRTPSSATNNPVTQGMSSTYSILRQNDSNPDSFNSTPPIKSEVTSIEPENRRDPPEDPLVEENSGEPPEIEFEPEVDQISEAATDANANELSIEAASSLDAAKEKSDADSALDDLNSINLAEITSESLNERNKEEIPTYRVRIKSPSSKKSQISKKSKTNKKSKTPNKKPSVHFKKTESPKKSSSITKKQESAKKSASSNKKLDESPKKSPSSNKKLDDPPKKLPFGTKKQAETAKKSKESSKKSPAQSKSPNSKKTESKNKLDSKSPKFRKSPASKKNEPKVPRKVEQRYQLRKMDKKPKETTTIARRGVTSGDNAGNSYCCRPSAPPSYIAGGCAGGYLDLLDCNSRRKSGGYGMNPLDRLKNVDVIESLSYYPETDSFCHGGYNCEPMDVYAICDDCGDVEYLGPKEGGSAQDRRRKPITYTRKQRFNFTQEDDGKTTPKNGPPYVWPSVANPRCPPHSVRSFDELPVGKNPVYKKKKRIFDGKSGEYVYDPKHCCLRRKEDVLGHKMQIVVDEDEDHNNMVQLVQVPPPVPQKSN